MIQGLLVIHVAPTYQQLLGGRQLSLVDDFVSANCMFTGMPDLPNHPTERFEVRGIPMRLLFESAVYRVVGIESGGGDDATRGL